MYEMLSSFGFLRLGRAFHTHEFKVDYAQPTFAIAFDVLGIRTTLDHHDAIGRQRFEFDHCDRLLIVVHDSVRIEAAIDALRWYVLNDSLDFAIHFVHNQMRCCRACNEKQFLWESGRQRSSRASNRSADSARR